MRAGYVAVIGLSLGFTWVACGGDDTSNNPAGSGGGSTTSAAAGTAGTSAGNGGSATGGSGGSAGSGGSGTGGGDASTGCQSACDCSDGVGCFNGECRSDISSVYCCTSAVCGMDVFKNALCQRPDMSFSRCGGLPDAGGKDGSIADYCPLFSCASGMPCPPDCKGMCDMNDQCHKM
jgi:hypothetical protein